MRYTVTKYTVPEMTVADYCRKCPAIEVKYENIHYCLHGFSKGNCRHEECESYAPCPHKLKKDHQ